MSDDTPRNRVFDFVLYIGVGVGILALALGYAEYSLRTGASGQLPLRWIGLAGATAVTFWYALRPYRHHWRRPSFWLTAGGLLFLHLALYTVVLLSVSRWPLLWFVPTSVVEGGLLVLLLNKVLSHSS